jgi:hypothetical protein
VLTPIDLDNDVPVTAYEIHIIGPNWLLTGELECAELPIAKIGPESRFSWCESAPQRSRSTNPALVLAAHAPHPDPLPAGGARELFRHLVLGQVLEDANQAGMVPAFAAERGCAVEQFLCCRGVGEGQVERAGALQGQV